MIQTRKINQESVMGGKKAYPIMERNDKLEGNTKKIGKEEKKKKKGRKNIKKTLRNENQTMKICSWKCDFGIYVRNI